MPCTLSFPSMCPRSSSLFVALAVLLWGLPACEKALCTRFGGVDCPPSFRMGRRPVPRRIHRAVVFRDRQPPYLNLN